MDEQARTYERAESRAPSGRGTWVAIILGLLAVGHLVAGRWVWSEIPLQTDAGIWAYIGRRLLEGSRLYLELWETKPPGIYYFFAGSEWLLGPNAERALSWMDGILSAAVLAVTYAVCRIHASRLISAGACLLCSLVLGHRVLADWGLNVEKFAALFEALALLIVLPAWEGRGSARRWLAMGICCGAAALFKQTGIALATAATLVLAHRETPRSRWLLPGLLWAGFAMVWGPVLVGLRAGGMLAGFLDQVVWYDFLRLGGGTEGGRIFSVEHWAEVAAGLKLAGALVAPAAVGWILASRRERTPGSPEPKGQGGEALIALQAAIILLVFCIAPHGYGHYLLQAAPPMTILLAWSAERLAGGPRARFACAAVALSALVGTVPLADHFRFLLDAEAPARSAYREQSERMARLVTVVQEVSESGQSVMLWPPDYAISFSAGRTTPLEISNADVLFKGKAYRLSPPHDTLTKYIAEHPPDVIVDTSEVRVIPASANRPSEGAKILLRAGVSLAEEPDPDHPMFEGRLLAPLKAWMRTHYGGQRRIGQCTVYFRGRPWKCLEEVLGITSRKS